MPKRIVIYLLIVAGISVVLGLYFRIWSLDQSGRAATPVPTPKAGAKPPTPPPALPKPEVSLAPKTDSDPIPEPTPPPPQPLSGEPAELVQLLGAPSYVDRRRASDALLKLGSKAVAPLQAAAKNRDPEIRQRAEKLLHRVYVQVFLANKQELTGTANDASKEKEWPCKLTVESFDAAAESFKGQIEWPSLKAIHEIEGSVKGGVLTFEETKYLKRGNAVLNCVYTFRPELETSWDGNTLKGIWHNADRSDSGAIEIRFGKSGASTGESATP